MGQQASSQSLPQASPDVRQHSLSAKALPSTCASQQRPPKAALPCAPLRERSHFHRLARLAGVHKLLLCLHEAALVFQEHRVLQVHLLTYTHTRTHMHTRLGQAAAVPFGSGKPQYKTAAPAGRNALSAARCVRVMHVCRSTLRSMSKGYCWGGYKTTRGDTMQGNSAGGMVYRRSAGCALRGVWGKGVPQRALCRVNVAVVCRRLYWARGMLQGYAAGRPAQRGTAQGIQGWCVHAGQQLQQDLASRSEPV